LVPSMANPLVTVVTPTWNRNFSVIRAIISVALQTYRPIQHIVVSDGPDPELKSLLRKITKVHAQADYELVLDCLPEHPVSARWGHFARLHGISRADGEFIAYLDDDDEFYPSHIECLSALLQQSPDAGFSYSRILIHDPGLGIVSGASPPAYSSISTSSIMHRKQALEAASWRDEGQLTVDWDLAERWVRAGVPWVFSEEITAQAHRDAPNADSDRPRNLD
jgi:GT2 family glycosyltransferase